jgi:hypothetical protein
MFLVGSKRFNIFLILKREQAKEVGKQGRIPQLIVLGDNHYIHKIQKLENGETADLGVLWKG